MRDAEFLLRALLLTGLHYLAVTTPAPTQSAREGRQALPGTPGPITPRAALLSPQVGHAEADVLRAAGLRFTEEGEA